MAGKHNITIDQGATWEEIYTWKISSVAVNLTGYSARMQIRKTHDASMPVVSLTSTPAAGLVLGGALGTITATITAAQTTALTPGNYVWDLELVSGSVVTRLLEGVAVIKPEVTR